MIETPMCSAEIKPGPGLNRAVGEAIGLVYETRPHPNDCDREILGAARTGWWHGGEYVGLHAPNYSTDLNAAMTAAEQVELFKRYGYCQASGRHVISKTVPVKSWMDTIADEATLLLAICAAILKLKETQH